MKFTGIEIQYFRSIGAEPVTLYPLKKCNVVVGQNNSGKSNVIKAMKKISDWIYDPNNKLEELDLHRRSAENPPTIRILFDGEYKGDDQKVNNLLQSNKYYFTFTYSEDNWHILDDTFADIRDFNTASPIFTILTNREWSARTGPEDIRSQFLQYSQRYFQKFASSIPRVNLIPEFRQIRPGDEYSHDGARLIEQLGEYRDPIIGHDPDQIKFEKIQRFVQELLHLPNAILEITRQGQESKIIISNNKLRLPLESYGTGVHELVILLTAVLDIENRIICIEEPEIHLHPRLQRELINFLIHETSNQYIISSHSPVFINYPQDDNFQVFHLTVQDGATRGGPILCDKDALGALHDLGISASDILQSNCIIWVEGPSDRNYINRWLYLIDPELTEGNDFVFFYYRELCRLNIDRNNFIGGLINILKINQNAILVIDSDKKSKHAELDKEKGDLEYSCNQNGGLTWVTSNREIENYIPLNVIKRFTNDIRNFEAEHELKPFEKLGEYLEKEAKEKGKPQILYDKDKTNYSKKIAELFIIEDIQGDLLEQVTKIANRIRKWKE